MSGYQRFCALLRMPNSDRAVLLITFGLTVLVDLTVAIAVGVTLASLLFVARMAEAVEVDRSGRRDAELDAEDLDQRRSAARGRGVPARRSLLFRRRGRTEEHTSELQSLMS